MTSDEALSGVECAFFIVDHDTFRTVSLDGVKELMTSTVITDGRNMFDGVEGIVYLGIRKLKL